MQIIKSRTKISHVHVKLSKSLQKRVKDKEQPMTLTFIIHEKGLPDLLVPNPLFIQTNDKIKANKTVNYEHHTRMHQFS